MFTTVEGKTSQQEYCRRAAAINLADKKLADPNVIDVRVEGPLTDDELNAQSLVCSLDDDMLNRVLDEAPWLLPAIRQCGAYGASAGLRDGWMQMTLGQWEDLHRDLGPVVFRALAEVITIEEAWRQLANEEVADRAARLETIPIPAAAPDGRNRPASHP